MSMESQPSVDTDRLYPVNGQTVPSARQTDRQTDRIQRETGSAPITGQTDRIQRETGSAPITGQTDRIQSGVGVRYGSISDCVEDNPEGYPILLQVPSEALHTRSQLEKYFQSKKSGGGECGVKSVNSGIYIVIFKYKEDKENVLRRGNHLIPIRDGSLNVTVVNKSNVQVTDEMEQEARNTVKQSTMKESQNKTLSDTQYKTQSDTKYKTLSDTQYNTQSDTKYKTLSDSQNKTQSDTQYKTQNDTKYNTQSDIQNKTLSDSQYNTQSGIQNKTLSDTQYKMEVESQYTMESDLNNGDTTHKASTKDHGEASARAPWQSSSKEFFTSVSAELDTSLVSQEQIHKALAECPSLRITNQSPGKITVTGSYIDMEKCYNYLQEQIGGRENSPPRRQGETMFLSTQLYEYFRVIYSEEIERIKHVCKVDFKHKHEPNNNTSLIFEPRGSDSDTEKAKQQFTDIIQKITSDWAQKEVNLSPQRIPGVKDIERCVREHFSKTFVIVDEKKVVLRGPEKEILDAKRFVEEGHINSTLSPRSMTILHNDTAANLKVNARHLNIIKKLKHREIQEIKEKYNVRIEESPVGADIQLKFRTVNGLPDLGPHASQMFLSLLQRTITNTTRKDISVTPGMEDRHSSVFAKSLQPEKPGITNKNDGQIASQVSVTGNAVNPSLKPDGGRARADNSANLKEPMDTSESSASATNKDSDSKDDTCPICLDTFTDKEILEKCKHAFCKTCLQQSMAHKPVCPICNVSYGVIIGSQPKGTMTHNVIYLKLPGFTCQTIQINYSFNNGIQGMDHPNPGKPYHGTHRTAYLPDTKDGQEILQLLKRAFDQRLVFTIGDSRTTGAKDCVTWNDIHHKTSTHGGPSHFGYPDPDYLNRVRDELKAKGIE
ncbi:E3 ubiquitin-protein ligase DTX3L [Pelobates fuscus]|uniref:E3 ubiquitin-protein ligase DTX3L n=1 Tax=Pelobates fuscus TaxID=191477 RepID=UPI002FE47C3F